MTQRSPNGSNGQSRRSSDEEVDLRSYFFTLMESRWLIGWVTLACIVVAIAYAVLATPIFRTDVLLQVEEKSAMAGLNEVSAMFSGETPAETEIEILRSRALVGTVVRQLGLDVRVEPKRLPMLGGFISRRWKGAGVRPPVLGLSRYSWGGERIQVERLTLPKELENQRLTLIALGGGEFDLIGPDEAFSARGEVGKVTTVEVGGVQLEIFVSALEANRGARFNVLKKNRDEAIAELQENLRIHERGKKTGIIQVALEGPELKKIAATLDSLAVAYVKQNVDRKSEEAERTLEFLNTQLPQLKQELERAEQALNSYRSSKGTVDLSLEAKALLERTVEVEKGLTQLDIEGAELRQRFTSNHPKLAAMRQQVSQLKAERQSIDDKLKQLPEAELNSARFMRDVQVANELYVLLLNKAQEMRVMKSGTIGNVRILDAAAYPLEPVAPKKAMTVAMGILLGMALGAGVALARKALNSGVEDPDEVEQSLGLPVYSTVPHSDFQGKQVRELERGRLKTIEILATAQKGDLAVESIRSLRTSLQFALMDAKNQIIAIGGPSPGIGKSFVSVNLAQVLAEGGKRVLLVDADMRKGKLHHYFNGLRSPGLSEVISGAADFDQVIQRDAQRASANLSFLSAGVVPPNPSELLMSPRFRELMDRASEEFDLVVVDCAPILAVTDGAIVGQLAGVNLFVLKSAQHPMGEIETAAKRYQQNGVVLKGVVFNQTAVASRKYAMGAYAYTYQYKY